MTDRARVADGLRALAALAVRQSERLDAIDPMVTAMRNCLTGGGTLFFAGNGGSAADAQHLATEYVVRYQAGNQRPMRAIALTTDTSALTAAGNDFGFERVFARQLEALARPGDVLIVHSTSGSSANCVVAVTVARTMGVITIGMLGGTGGALVSLVDHAFVVPDAPVNQVQEIHLAVQHQIAAILTGEHGG